MADLLDDEGICLYCHEKLYWRHNTAADKFEWRSDADSWWCPASGQQGAYGDHEAIPDVPTDATLSDPTALSAWLSE